MGVFSNIMSKIFGGAAHAESAPAAGASASPSTSSTGGTTASAAPAGGSVDVEKVVSEMAAAKGETLNWKTSIVDLMKVLDLDSSLTARKELAHELHYTGDTNDSATMNVWLHKQVMKKLAENGGKVPADLKD